MEESAGCIPPVPAAAAAVAATAERSTSESMIIKEPITQEFVFDNCKISHIFISAAKKFEDHMVYVIQVTVGDCQWLVTRRYRQFYELHELLVKYYNVEKKLLPPKKIFGNMAEYFVSTRKVKLEQYLKQLVNTFKVPPLELLQFLNYQLYDVMSITQRLSTVLCDKSDAIMVSGGYISLTPVQVYCIHRRLQIPVESNCHGENDIHQLYNFFNQLQKLKIVPTLNQTLNLMADVAINLAPFKSLISLRLEAVEVQQCNGLESLYTQLTCLEVHRCKSKLWEFLAVDKKSSSDVEQRNNNVDRQPNDNHDGSPTVDACEPPIESLIKRSYKWPRLRRLIFKYNNLEKIDEGLKLAPYLEELDLSHNDISVVENLSELTELKVLDLRYNQLSRVDQLGLQLGNISKLSLAHNQIILLEGFRMLYCLTYLNLSHNSLANIKEVKNLSALDRLEKLFLKGNSLTQMNDYRIRVFTLLSKTWQQLSLDGVKATTDEQDAINRCQSTGSDKDDTIDSQENDLQLSAQDNCIKSPTSSTKSQQFSESDCVTRAAVRKSKVETMRKEGGDKWLAMLNAEREQPSCKLSIHKRGKSRSSKKKRRSSDFQEKNDTEAIGPKSLPTSPLNSPLSIPSSLPIIDLPPSPAPPLFQKCSLQKPTLASDMLHKFFLQLPGVSDEVLLYIEWCSCVQWSSSPDFEKDVGVFVTNKSIHILGITDTNKSSYSWENEKLPLLPLHSIPFTKLRQVVVGLFKQSLRLETNNLEDVVVLFTHNADHTTSFSETLKAAMDAESIKYNIFTTTELQQQRITGDDCTFVELDEMDECVLKRQLVQEEVVDSQLATCYSTTLSTGESLQPKIHATADAITIRGYFTVSMIQAVSKEFYYRTLVITDERIIMCDEDYLHWPPPLSMTVIPTTSKIQVLQAELLTSIAKLELYREPQLVRGTRDGIYEAFLVFMHVGEFGEKSETGWYFCLQGSAELEQFVTTMESSSVTVHNAPTSMWSELSSRNPTVEIKDFSPVSVEIMPACNPNSLVHTIGNLSDVSSKEQQEYFHNHISQFPNQESIKFAFSCMCIPFTTPNLNLQVFTYITSQALYFLTDPQSMKQWMEGGGKCPFASHSFDLQRSNRPLCFQYVIFQQLKDICVGLFYQYIRISGGNASNTFTLMTQKFDLTHAILEALPSNHHEIEESIDNSFAQLVTQYSASVTQHSSLVTQYSSSVNQYSSSVNQYSSSVNELHKGRSYLTPKSNSVVDNAIHFKTTYQEHNTLLSTLGEAHSEPVMILKYMIVKFKDDATDVFCSMVLTDHKLYIVNEDFVHWPTPPFTCIPSQSQYSVLKSCSLHDIVRVETKRRQACNFAVVCKGSELKLPNQAPHMKMTDDESLVSELMEKIKIDTEVKRLSLMATASHSAIRGLTTWHLSVQNYEDRERFLQVLATAYEDIKKEKLLVTAT